MSNIPLPALDVSAPQQQDTLENYARLLQLRNSVQNQPLQTQILQQQAQAGQLENQQRQQQMQDSQTLRSISPSFVKKGADGNVTGYDFDGFFNKAASSGVSPQTLSTLQKGISDATLAKANATKAQLDNEKTLNDQAFQHLEGLRGATDPEQRQQMWSQTQQWLQQNAGTLKINPGQIPQQPPDDKGLTAVEATLGMHAQQLSDAAKTAETAKNTAQAGEAGATTAKTNAELNYYEHNGGAPGIPAETQELNSFLKTHKGATAADFPVYKASAEAAARQPYEMALARQKQALSQGDPNAAAQLLVNGDATLSELKSRGATPDFIANTLSAAHKLSNGGYNAQAADAQFNVAKSQANTAFFGSAKSLTDKGGTLDQLAKAGEKIPGNQIPAFNSLEDWQKAATGSGPLAHYASTALGVADDYAKVMGGGQGSDTSRLQALNLIKSNASPEARTGALQGIRDAVKSQTSSRIGNNSIMQRMYGDTVQSTGGGVTVTAPDGSTHTFKDQASADKFRKLAGIQ